MKGDFLETDKTDIIIVPEEVLCSILCSHDRLMLNFSKSHSLHKAILEHKNISHQSDYILEG